jgi:hypothetical protein
MSRYRVTLIIEPDEEDNYPGGWHWWGLLDTHEEPIMESCEVIYDKDEETA